MLKTQAGETVVEASKQPESKLFWTVTAVLVPPEPKRVLSLT